MYVVQSDATAALVEELVPVMPAWLAGKLGPAAVKEVRLACAREMLLMDTIEETAVMGHAKLQDRLQPAACIVRPLLAFV